MWIVVASREAATESSLGRRPSLFVASFAATPRQLAWQVKQFSRLATQPAKPAVSLVVRLPAACGGGEPDHGNGRIEVGNTERYS